jgi:hypothetical protein
MWLKASQIIQFVIVQGVSKPFDNTNFTWAPLKVQNTPAA